MAIMGLKSGKSAGPDGYTEKYYKKMSATVLPHLHHVFSSALETEGLPIGPQIMYEAVIIVIPKKGKDPKEVGSY